MRSGLRLLHIALFAGVVAACDLPRSGPSHRAVMGAQRLKAAPTDIKLIEADAATVSAANVIAPMKVDNIFYNRRAFAANEIGVGDILTLTVFENVQTPLLGNEGQRIIAMPLLVVDEKGNIFLPYVGELHVGGLSLAGLREKISIALMEQTPDPQIVVERKPGNAGKVLVLGVSAKQGFVPLEPEINRLAGVIAAAGGSTANAEDTVVTVVRGKYSAEFRLDELLLDVDQDIPLYPKDRVVLREDKRSISVFGAATNQGSLKFAGANFALTDAIAGAGGLNAGRAYPKGVFVYRLGETVGNMSETVYHFDLSQVQGTFLASQFLMRDKDVLYLADAPFVNFTRVIDALRGTASSGQSIAALAK